MLTKSEKLVWAASFVLELNKTGNTRNAVLAAYEDVSRLRSYKPDFESLPLIATEMLNSMQEMKQ